ncbi:hypothetical protein R6Q59_014072 [Mikania micrantha]
MGVKKVVLRTEGRSDSNTSSSANVRVHVTYGKCRKNFGRAAGKFIFDGCQKFMKRGVEGTEAAFICAACSCNRECHEMTVENEVV